MIDNIYFLIVVGMLGIFLVLLLLIITQVKNQNRLLHQQRKLTEAEIHHQKSLLEAVINSQETERQRIGRDLHDEVGSVLSSLRLLIEKNTQAEGARDNATAFTLQSKLLIDRIINNTRQIAHNLSPRISGEFGFYDAVHELSDTVNQSGAIQLSLAFDEGIAAVPMKEAAAMALYRVLAELINNTIKHAQAANIGITITVKNQEMKIDYSDDGRGFSYHANQPNGGMGMRNIESRLDMINAGWQIPESTGKGFRIQITIPLQ